MITHWNPYYLANLLFTGSYVTLFLVLLSRFSSDDPRNDAFRRLLIAILGWAYFDLAVNLIGRTISPELGHDFFRYLSFLFLFYSAAAAEMIVALMTRVTVWHRVLLYGPYLILYLLALAAPSWVSGASLGLPKAQTAYPYWNIAFKAYSMLLDGGLFTALFIKARRQSDKMARNEMLVLFAGGIASWAGIFASQVLLRAEGPGFPWLANLFACFIALAAFWGIRRYGRVFSPRSLYEATLRVVPSGLAHFRAGRVVWANGALADLLGIKEPRALLNLDAAAILKSSRGDMAQAMAEGRLLGQELTLAGPGTKCLVSSVPLDKNDPLRGAVAVFQDMSALKEAEEEKSLAQRLAGAIETAGAVCHELNQPLQAVLSRVELMGMRSDAEKQQADLASLMASIDEISAITNRLQGITKYHTKEYLEGVNILDLKHSSDASASTGRKGS